MFAVGFPCSCVLLLLSCFPSISLTFYLKYLSLSLNFKLFDIKFSPQVWLVYSIVYPFDTHLHSWSYGHFLTPGHSVSPGFSCRLVLYPSSSWSALCLHGVVSPVLECHRHVVKQNVFCVYVLMLLQCVQVVACIAASFPLQFFETILVFSQVCA